MHRWRKTSMVFTITVALILTSSGFQAVAQGQESGEKANAESMIIDFLILRPLGIAATGVGTVIFVGSLPFSVPGGNTKEVFRKLVEEPAKFTFSRPLGKLEGMVFK